VTRGLNVLGAGRRAAAAWELGAFAAAAAQEEGREDKRRRQRGRQGRRRRTGRHARHGVQAPQVCALSERPCYRFAFLMPRRWVGGRDRAGRGGGGGLAPSGTPASARRAGARRWSAPLLVDGRPAACRALSLSAAVPSSSTRVACRLLVAFKPCIGGERRGSGSGRRRQQGDRGGGRGQIVPLPPPPPTPRVSPPLECNLPNHGAGAAPEPGTAQQQTKLRGLSRPALSVLAASARAALARPPFSGAQTTRHPQPPNQPSARLGPTRLPDLARPPKEACSQFKRQSDRPQTLVSVSFCFKEGAQTRAFASGARVKVDS